MCEANAAGEAPPPPERRTRRWKLWDIDIRFHCSIVGTCLSLGDLRRIASKLGLPIGPQTADYDIHAHFVASAGRPGPLAKAMQKALDRKHDTAIRRFGRVKDEGALTELWQRCLDDGDVAGPYWALVTHPAASEALAAHAYRHVHMLSHLVGAANRADIRRLRALEAERDTLADDLAEARRRHAEREIDVRRLMESHAAEVRDLTRRLREADADRRRLAGAEDRVRDLESGEVHRALTAEVDALRRRLAEAGAHADVTAAREREIERLQRANEDLRRSAEVATAEREALEAALTAGLDGDGDGAAMDLCGRRIVYVGGRARLIPRLKAVVEDANGIFIHHDGGIEENGDRLNEVLARGDAILCPVDCVSHTACRLAKQMCKRHAKTFVPLRSAGLSSFVSGLWEIASANGQLAASRRAT